MNAACWGPVRKIQTYFVYCGQRRFTQDPAYVCNMKASSHQNLKYEFLKEDKLDKVNKAECINI